MILHNIVPDAIDRHILLMQWEWLLELECAWVFSERGKRAEGHERQENHISISTSARNKMHADMMYRKQHFDMELVDDKALFECSQCT